MNRTHVLLGKGLVVVAFVRWLSGLGQGFAAARLGVAVAVLFALVYIGMRYGLVPASSRPTIVLLVPDSNIGKSQAQRFKRELASYRPVVNQNPNLVVHLVTGWESNAQRLRDISDLYAINPTVIIATSHDVAAAVLTEPPPASLRAVIFATRDNPAELLKLAKTNGHQSTGTRSLGERDDAARARLLDEWLPGLRNVGVLTDPDAVSRNALIQAREHWPTTVQITDYVVVTEADITKKFEAAKHDGMEAILIGDNNVAAIFASAVAKAALQYRLPVVSEGVVLCDAAPAICFFTTTTSHHERWLEAILQVLNGVRANDIPVAGTDRALVICNVGAASAIGVPLPPSIFLRAEYAYGQMNWDRLTPNKKQ